MGTTSSAQSPGDLRYNAHESRDAAALAGVDPATSLGSTPDDVTAAAGNVRAQRHDPARDEPMTRWRVSLAGCNGSRKTQRSHDGRTMGS